MRRSRFPGVLVASLALLAGGCFKDKGSGDAGSGADSTSTSETSDTTDSESGEGTATESTDASTTDTSTTDTTTDSTETAAETGGLPPVEYGECPGGMADECTENDPLCVEEFGGGSTGNGGSYSEWFSLCTRTCETAADCATDVVGGTAESVCLDYDGTMICALDCQFGKTCPDGYQCEFDICVHMHCDCSGDGCVDCPDPEGN